MARARPPVKATEVATQSPTTAGGGGFGGAGGAGAGGALGGSVYGVVSEPQGPGSAGGGETGVDGRGNSGGPGGGGIEIQARGTLALGGMISANGASGRMPGGGGGSGGSVSLTVGELTGAGVISANGGAGQLPGGGGGGGRIAVIGPASLFTGRMSARGGAGFASGGAGTIYTTPNSQNTQAQIIVDNGGLRNAPTSLASVESVSTLTVRNGAIVTSPPRFIGSLSISCRKGAAMPAGCCSNESQARPTRG